MVCRAHRGSKSEKERWSLLADWNMDKAYADEADDVLRFSELSIIAINL